MDMAITPSGIVATTQPSPRIEWPSGRNFTPHAIPFLRGWWAADLESWRFSDDDPINAMLDHSGRKQHIAASGGLMPTFKTGILNGKPVMRFDGAANYLQSSTMVRDATETICLVMKATAGTSKLVACAARNYANRGSIFTHPATYNGLAGTSGTILHNGNASIGDTWIYAVVTIGNGANGIVRVSGDEVTGNIGTDKGGGIRVGAEGSDPAADFFAGDIAEVIVYKGSLSDVKIARIEKYMKNKYQL
jgi:hypothetical protein